MSKGGSSHLEEAVVEDGIDKGEKFQVDKAKVNVSGTVQLTAGKIVYIPAPTADPRGLSGSRLPLRGMAG
jgi:hypothetical protein